MQGHIDTIDFMKGVGIILVVLGHALDGIRAGLSDAGSLSGLIFDWIYSFHMPLFFSISGFILAYRQSSGTGQKGERRNYILSHLLNYGILYFIYSVLYCVSKIVFSGFVALTVTWKDILLLPVRAVGPYWFLYVLFILYAVFAPLYSDSFPALPVFILLIPLCAVGERIGRLPFELARVMKFSLYYSFGILSCRFLSAFARKEKKSSRILMALTASFIISTVSYAVILNRFLSGWMQTIPGIIAALSYIVLINCLSALVTACGRWPCRFWTKFFTFLGRHSLEIFLLHVFFLTAAIRLLSFLPQAAVILLSSAAGIVFPLVIEFAAKKMGIDGLLFSPGRLLIKRYSK